MVFCKADKKDELTDPPIVLKCNTFTILDAADMDEITTTAYWVRLMKRLMNLLEMVADGCCII